MTQPLLTVSVIAPEGTQKVGARVPIRVEVRNVSAAPVWVVGVLGGSEEGQRFPHYRPEIEGPPPATPPEFEGCGNVPPLRMQEFRRLLPGESFDPTDASGGASYLPLASFNNFVPGRAGRYRARLVLDMRSDNAEEWLGMLGYPGEAEVLERLRQVPRLRVESNVATIEVG
jgi:hypothetical protein